MRYRFTDDSRGRSMEIGQVPQGAVCRNARFVFDEPVTIYKDEEIELIDGQWFLVIPGPDGEVLQKLNGKWDR